MKKVFLTSLSVAFLLSFVLVSSGCQKKTTEETSPGPEQAVYASAIDLSKKYLNLRYRTDHVLIEARSFSGYEDWKQEMSEIIKDWEDLEKETSALETSASGLALDDTGFQLISSAKAVTREEINTTFDKAPAGQKIKALAKLLGVDAKRAYAILTQEQNQIQADAWNEAGDTFKKLETSAVVIKDGCKVAGFVGTVVLTGGTAGFAASGALAQTAVVVGGADLVLEVTDDAATIALGDKNKVSKITGSLRTVTEPAASILTIAAMPGNLSKGIEKLNAVSFGSEQVRSAVQDGKVLGIKISTDAEGKATIEASSMEEAEVENWKKENNIEASPEKAEEILGVANPISESKPSESPAEPVTLPIETEAKTEEAAPEAEANKTPTAEQGNNTETKNGQTVGRGISDEEFESIVEGLSSEYDYIEETDDYISRKNKKGLLGAFGSPDVEGKSKGRDVWIYHGLIKSWAGNDVSVAFSFYDTDQVAVTQKRSKEEIVKLLD